MYCNCCKSNIIEPKIIWDKKYYFCTNCHLLFSNSCSDEASIEKIQKHYAKTDPFEKVAISKNYFFNKVLDIIDSPKTVKRILDIGCGYGHFLELAKTRGWEIRGIEIVEDAVSFLNQKHGTPASFFRSIQEGNFGKCFFDVITLWDVLVIVDNPAEVLKECHIMLKEGGKIGIRVRNVSFQMIAYFFYTLIKGIAQKLGFKNPSVFHKYCFSSDSIYQLLSHLNYKNIKITNSPLTSGDPYTHSKLSFLTNICKILISLISKNIFWLSKGKLLIGPSLLIWAEKPYTK
jgi:2-polyprenyl-3-methyl-5-hydroxy-6-metoxy-1,4-benzoquinol methylase